MYLDIFVNLVENKQNGKGVFVIVYGYIVFKLGIERFKINIFFKSRGKSVKKKDLKFFFVQFKLGKRRGGVKSKSKNLEDVVVRLKSGKRIKLGRRRKKILVDLLLGKQVIQLDIVLILGIGWYVVVSCIDKFDVVVVKCIDFMLLGLLESEYEDMEEEIFDFFMIF